MWFNRRPNAKDNLPRVWEVTLAVLLDPDIGYCLDVPSDALALPVEVWLPSIKVWLRIDGSYYSGDQCRGFYNPGFFERRMLRKAIAIREEAGEIQG